ncbi:pyruvate, water dikinase regulatory protein [Natranaerobius trueperi]|uniref:Putative pyruvate, phosphate dikinase regulatory protein n=1 Tax=Natranaerobius trueperi TaxID=759412 RepID=A0A226BWA7_9FIRM|nr:pyruvate, water dikinase regulatory protein [Natranaerobius trueperi]OWZ83072.1 phosphoenolpyruvate synthase regulatory protein [Natranaerobius trueperi]
MTPDQTPICYIVSDSIGETAELVVKAVSSQFNAQDCEFRRIPYANDIETIKEVVQEAQHFNSLVAYTLVDPELREYMEKSTREYRIQSVDIMGPMLTSFQKLYKKSPKLEPGLVRKLDESYFKRVDAIEFAVKYDDGKDPRGILQADVTLIGVSRTSKTPLSMYLANKRIKVANLPLVPEVKPPKELFQAPKEKIIGLVIDPYKLNDIRKERLKTLGLRSQANYAKMDRILSELEFCENIIKEVGCPTIDVSNRAVEETAQKILHMIRGREENE